MTVDVICPLYNAEKYIDNLHKSILMQENVKLKNIRYILTESKDATEEKLKRLDRCIYYTIKSEEFSHSLTREKEAFKSDVDIIVFITQDVIIKRKDWLFNLVNPIENEECEASYSRQICTDKKSIEYYTRQKNYPNKSIIKTKADIKKMGMNAFFFSDASSAIKREVFVQLNGYDKKNLPTNEDMYIAYKLLTNNFKIKYCANSEVIHSHNFTLKETYNRYKSYGQFLKQEPYLNIKSNKAGGGLAKYILKEAVKDGNFPIILKFLPDMIARYIGMKLGKRSNLKYAKK